MVEYVDNNIFADNKDFHYDKWKRDIDYANEDANFYSIKSYAILNIRDLTINTLLKFMQDVFCSAKNICCNDKNNSKDSLTNSAFISPLLNNGIDIEYITKNIIDAISLSNILHFSNNISDNIQVIFTIIDMNMSSLYSYMVSSVFDPFIIDHINNAIKSNALDQLFDLLYYKCYNEEIDKYPDIQFEYSFCSSIMREIMENNMNWFRVGLVEISKNIALMFAESKKSAKSNNLIRKENHNSQSINKVAF